MAFPSLPDVGADELERRQLALWKEEDLFRRTLEANREGVPFVFYEGPPTANGRPGIHHVFSRTIKDLICRFHAMQGKSVTRIAGWDTHGLPVEIEVEKELKLNGKKAIEEFGVPEFNARARQSVFKYQAEWESLSDRIAYWLDYEHPYVTCSNDYIESVWWLLAAARCSPATSWRWDTRTSPPTRSTSPSRSTTAPAASCWCGPPRRGP
jgi:isoleucyl-tRNA synthetase